MNNKVLTAVLQQRVILSGVHVAILNIMTCIEIQVYKFKFQILVPSVFVDYFLL